MIRCVRLGMVLWLSSAAVGALAADATNAPASVDRWVVRSWQTKDGMPQETVNALVQTKDGYLWIGTGGGLAQFDGVRFRTFGLEHGLRSVQVFSLHEDPSGVLWVGTVGGGLSRWERGRFATWGAAEGFPASTVHAIAGERDGTLWVGTDRGLVRMRDGTFQMQGEQQGILTKQVRALLLDSRGALWVSVTLGGLYRGTNGLFAPIRGTNQAPGGAYCLAEDRDGNVWAGADTGQLWRWREDVWKKIDTTNALPQKNIEVLARGTGSTLWVGSRDAGLAVLGEGKLEGLAGTAGLTDETVRSLVADDEGTVWIGTASGGLRRLSRAVLRSWGVEEGLAHSAISTVAADEAGRLWVGTPNHGIYRFDQGRFTKLNDPAVSRQFPYLYASATTEDGSVWLAGEQCLFRFHTGRKTEAFHDAPVRGEAIRALCADGTNLWLGTYHGTLLKFDGASLRTVGTNGFLPGDITSLAREGPERLWIGTGVGLHLWEAGKVTSWTTSEGLLTASIRALHRDADGTLWIGTLGGGLACLRAGRLTNITTRQGLSEDVISQIVADDFGRLWLGGNRGLMSLDRRELDDFAAGRIDSVHPIILGRDEGMRKEQCAGGHSPGAMKSRDGMLFFPTMGGMVEVDPRRLNDLTNASPLAVIEELLVDGELQSLRGPIVIPPGNHRLEMTYTAPSLRKGEWVRFRTRLEGLDRDWVLAGSRHTATYSILRPRRYVFQVEASNPSGTWSSRAASLTLVVQPYFWQTLWFAGLLAVAVATGVYIAYRRHLSNLQGKRLEQEAFTRQLINAQEAERARLARELHDDITQRLARLAIDAGRVEQVGAGDNVRATMRGVREGLVRLSEDVHRLSYRLHSSLLEDLGLAEALRAECERFTRQEGIICDLKLRDLPEEWPRDLALAVFRVVQEALQNVARHARASMVEVTLRQLDDGIQLAIHDNGLGFDPTRKRVRMSLGLVGMRERMRLLGGELDIESSPGDGTTIVAWAPWGKKG